MKLTFLPLLTFGLLVTVARSAWPGEPKAEPVPPQAKQAGAGPTQGEVIDGKTLGEWKAWAQPGASADQRCQAARALGRVRGEGLKEGVPILMQLLEDQAGPVRQAAVAALGQLGPAAEEAIPTLAKLAEKEERVTTVRFIRRDAISALGRMGPQAIPTLAELAAGPDPYRPFRHEAVQALGRMGPQAIPALTKLAEQRDAFGLHILAINLLGDAGPQAIPALTKLAEQQGDVGRQWAAVSALEKIGPESLPALKQLFPKLPYDLHAGVIRMWLRTGRNRAPEILSFLLPFLEDKDALKRRDVARALAVLGAEAHAAVPALVKLLRDESPQVRVAASRALGAIAQALPPDTRRQDIVAALLPVARDQAVEVRLAVVAVLISCEAKEATPVFRQSLQDEYRGVRELAVRGLGSAARKGDKEVIPVLTRLLQDQDSQTRIVAAGTLGSVAPEAVWDAVRDQPPAIRADAASGLGRSAFPAALTTLRKFFHDQDPSVQAAAARGLSIQSLRSLAADSDPDVRSLVARELAVKPERKRKWRDEAWEKEHGRRSGK